MHYKWNTFVFSYFLYLMKGSYGGTCSTNCASKTCDDPDGGCPKCERNWWGRQCDNPMGCFWADDPAKYRGTASVTVSGRVCQQWSSNTPHKHRFGNLTQGAKNYCRSSDNHPTPWCYTTNKNVRWEVCDVPTCDSKKLCPVPPFPVHKVLPVGVPFSKPFFSGTSLRVVNSCGTLQREATIWCQSNKTWASSEGCTDLTPFCPRPALERNSYIFADHDSVYHHNDTVDIRCLPGFNIRGYGILECQEDGSWNGTLPTCFMNGSHLCPPMCEDDLTCDNEDRGCPKCKPTRWGRHCEYRVECFNTERGSDYRGIQNRTANGILCQNWKSQSPHSHPLSNRVDDGAANYCRNPDLELTPWCYTTNSRVRWQQCNVPKCDTVCPPPTLPMYSHLVEVTNKPFNIGYNMFVEMRCADQNVTMVTTCQDDLTWSHNVSCEVVHCVRPTLHNNSFIVGDATSRLYAQNDTIEVQCPEGFTQKGGHLFRCQGDRSWNGTMPTCDGGICPPMCAEGVPCTEPDGACPRCKPGWWGRHCQYPMECYDGRGANYKGTTAITVSGRKCQEWMSNSPHRHKLKLANSGNLCRNPDNEPKPWCYTVDPKRRWEVCPVPRCNNGALCPPPTLPMYSSVLSPVNLAFYTGSTLLVNLTCGDTQEQVNIICQANRKWTMNRLSCSLTFCASPALKNNSRIIEDTGGPYQQNDTIQVACDQGFETKGQTIFNCQNNSQWNGTMPACEGVRCPELRPTTNSFLMDKSVQYTYTHIATVECDTGYRLIGEAHLHCQADGTWNSSLPICQAVVCPVPLLNDHSFVENGSDSFSFGDVIMVRCKDGYQLYGYDTFVCKNDGSWDGKFPVCKGTCPLHCKANQTCVDTDGGCPECDSAWWGRHCEYPLGCRLTQKGKEYRGDINSTVNGRVCQEWSDTTLHSHRYAKFVDKEARNFCRNPDNEISPWCYTLDPDVRWEICPVPLCSSLNQCPPPVLPQNVTVVNPPKIAFFTGSVLLLELQCGEGLRTVATPRISCQENGTWTYSIPTCQAVRCKHQPLPDHTYITGMFVTHFPYVVTVQVSCKDGYTLEGTSELTCSEQNYSWNLERTRCRAVMCPKPKLLSFSYIDPIKNEYPYGSQVLVKCINQYNRVGQGSFSCLSDGRWDGEMPECKAPSCSLPDVPPSHVVIVRSLADLSPGGNVTVVCRGLHNGTSVLQCLPNGTFSGAIPKCNGVKCPLPTLTNNSYIEHRTLSFVYGDALKILCKRGFTPKSHDVLTCQLDGSWFGQVPECVPVTCSPPDMPPEKYVIMNRSEDMNVGGTLQLNCVSGMELKGPAELTCLVNGSWSYDTSECIVSSCSSPVLPDHSVIVRGMKTVYSYRDKILVICAEGYSPQIPVALACQHDKTWNGTMHRCDALSCQVPTPPDTLQYIINSSSDLLFGGTLTVACKSGYKTVGNKEMICEANGHWGGHLPDCQAMMCALPSLSSDLYVMVEQGSGVTPGDVISIWCRPGMRVVGSSYMKCLKDGTWNASTPTCQYISCAPPLEVEYNIIPKKTSYLYKDIVSIKCKDGFELQGSRTLQCGLDGTWGKLESICTAVKCPLPTLNDLHVMKMDAGASLSVGGVISVGCKNDKKYVGLMCTKDKRWNSSLPACDKIKGKTPLKMLPEADSGEELSVLDKGIIAACVIIILGTAVATATYFLVRKFRRKTSRKSSNINITYKDMEDEL
ncbi:sushi, von Willebrand factor type A, EGF and pentraxin domain-containing protein 1-like isoform X2 [Pecten maximus]|uniref:sushi, von Willebrand factor type A, EGF and pentraxin domain-containing protein 1-like isoform X2 n=1 Tax=Pecten maximus TaxID=6579 RepID=UPI0014581A85|nr:sushi, von Willebrand factor type A, EGF and pentraxin domain-containing protein 1-like isoform X2 [Pecten maximus]